MKSNSKSLFHCVFRHLILYHDPSSTTSLGETSYSLSETPKTSHINKLEVFYKIRRWYGLHLHSSLKIAAQGYCWKAAGFEVVGVDNRVGFGRIEMVVLICVLRLARYWWGLKSPSYKTGMDHMLRGASWYQTSSLRVATCYLWCWFGESVWQPNCPLYDWQTKGVRVAWRLFNVRLTMRLDVALSPPWWPCQGSDVVTSRFKLRFSFTRNLRRALIYGKHTETIGFMVISIFTE